MKSDPQFIRVEALLKVAFLLRSKRRSTLVLNLPEQPTDVITMLNPLVPFHIPK